MASVSDLLNLPITYDIIVSDFGRDATIEYLRLVANSEKRLITSILEPNGYDFFDEYRRNMFTIIGDLAFFKDSAIADSIASKGYFTDNILIGVGSSVVTQDFADRLALSILQEVLVALNRGHKRFRIMVPCNTLSLLMRQIGQRIFSIQELERIAQAHSYRPEYFERIVSSQISVHTVPETVIQHLVTTKKSNKNAHLLVIGTRDTNVIYAQLIDTLNLTILPLRDSEYQLIDRAIVASIAGNPDRISQCRDELEKELIEPRQKLFEDLIVLEACTDFHLGLGTSSLELFADAMVSDCYQL